MTSEQTTVGVDCRSGRYYTARVRRHTSGHKVTALVTIAESELKDHEALEGGDVVFSIPDNEVAIKNLRLNQDSRWDTDLLAQFELSQSLLDDENEFCFAALSTGRPKRFLGLVTRRRNLEQLTDSLFSSVETGALSPKYEMRAVALGKGYINFCHPEQGELACLVDFGNEAASISFILEGNIIGVSYLLTGQFDLDTEAGLKKMAIEFKTVVNFRLASLFDGRAAPSLSALIVSGVGCDSSVRFALEQHFQIAVTAPRIDRRFLEEAAATAEEPLEDYLVAMGLTVY